DQGVARERGGAIPMTFITTTPSKIAAKKAAMKRERAYRPEDVPVALGLLEKILGDEGIAVYVDYGGDQEDIRLEASALPRRVNLTEDECALISRILGES